MPLAYALWLSACASCRIAFNEGMFANSMFLIRPEIANLQIYRTLKANLIIYSMVILRYMLYNFPINLGDSKNATTMRINNFIR